MEKSLITLDDGREAWEYENGARRDAVTGQFIAPPVAGPGVITGNPTKAGALARRRWEAIYDAIDDGLAAVAADGLPASTLRRIVEKRARVAIESDGHSGNEAAELIFRLVGLLDRRQAAGLPVDDGLTVTVGSELARDILAAVAGVRAARAEDVGLPVTVGLPPAVGLPVASQPPAASQPPPVAPVTEDVRAGGLPDDASRQPASQPADASQPAAARRPPAA